MLTFEIVRRDKGGTPQCGARLEKMGAYFDLEEVLWRAVDLLEALLA